ncbi:unnamed protein product [Sphenostylis stenocarpa]|uniref:Bet v I/Major latex protein domain-containing protein n=1 Tax=Sphenostylis stenocarpa TaxID=92480 RepID=A0AA86VPC6_9FABA|nr:unnamed protein product [Sphenostylis stenocarpa]
MGIVTTEREQVCAVAPATLFKAMAFDFSNVFPKAVPNFVKVLKSLETEGLDPSRTSFLVMVDVVEEENYVYHYTVDEGSVLPETLEKVCYEYKLVASPGGGCIIKCTIKYYTKDDAQLKDMSF